MTEDLDKAWHSYTTTRDCLKIARKAIGKEEYARLLGRTSFIEASLEEANQDIEESQKHAEDYIILTLWVYFERKVFFLLKQDIVNPGSKLLNEKIHEHIERIGMTNVVLETLKDIMDKNLIGQVTQIYAYRNWIAHRNPNKRPSAIIVPNTAYDVLSEVLRQLDGIINAPNT